MSYRFSDLEAQRYRQAAAAHWRNLPPHLKAARGVGTALRYAMHPAAPGVASILLGGSKKPTKGKRKRAVLDELAPSDVESDRRSPAWHTELYRRPNRRVLEHKMAEWTLSPVYGSASLSTRSDPAGYLLNVVASGDNSNQRTGRQIQLTSVFARFDVYNNHSGVVNIRVLVVQDLRCNTEDHLHPLTDLFKSSGDGGVHQPFDPDHKGRIKVLYDDTKLLRPKSEGDACTGRHKQNIRYDLSFPMNGLITRFTGTGGGRVVGQISDNPIWLFVLHDSAAGGILLDNITDPEYGCTYYDF